VMSSAIADILLPPQLLHANYLRAGENERPIRVISSLR
jgi:hypothetical protein